MIKKTGLFPPFIFGLAPALFLYLNNPGQILASELLIPAAIVFAVSLLVYMFFNFIQGQSSKASILTSLTMLLFFSYGPIQQFIKNFPPLDFISPHHFLMPLILLIPAFLCFIIKNSESDFNGSARFTLFASLFLTAFFTVRFSQQPSIHLTAAAHPPIKIQQDIPLLQHDEIKKPDIYYIILDGYARPDFLKKNYGFNDETFINELTAMGFYVAGKSTSNYTWTPLSMAASLNMTYLDELEKSPGRDSKDFGPLREMISQNRLTSFLQKAGYTPVTFATGYTTLDRHPSGIQIKPKWLPDDFQITLLRNTPLAYLLELVEGPHLFYRERLMHIFNSLPKTADMAQPVFVYAHIMAPHYPFLFDRNGRPLVSRTNELWDYPFAERHLHSAAFIADYRKDYSGYVAFTNSQIIQVIRNILQKSPEPPVIILQSDHGAAFTADLENPDAEAMSERMSILNAYFVPLDIRKELYPGITPVNSFRLILNGLFHTGLPLLEDSNFYSGGTYPYRFKNITGILKERGVR